MPAGDCVRVESPLITTPPLSQWLATTPTSIQGPVKPSDDPGGGSAVHALQVFDNKLVLGAARPESLLAGELEEVHQAHI